MSTARCGRRSSSTCSRTPSSSRSRARSASRCARDGDRASSSAGHRQRHPRRESCRTSSSASTASKATHGRTHEGTGIGLALVQELVSCTAARSTVASVLGAGSAFTVTRPLGRGHLPPTGSARRRRCRRRRVGADAFVEEALQLAAARRPATRPIAERRRRARPTRILVADDNADMRDYLKRLLGGRWDVEVVGNGAGGARLPARPPRRSRDHRRDDAGRSTASGCCARCAPTPARATCRC